MTRITVGGGVKAKPSKQYINTSLGGSSIVKNGDSSGVSTQGTLRPTGKYVGPFNPSLGLPTVGSGKNGAILKGDFWDASASGTIVGIEPFTDFVLGDLIYANQNNAVSVSHFFGNKALGGGGSNFIDSYGSLSALIAANPTPTLGDYAYVDFGADYPAIMYYWDANSGEWRSEHEDISILCKYDGAAPTAKGKIVYSSGSTGQMLKVKVADNTSEATSSRTFGIILCNSIGSSTIAVGDECYVVTFGFLKNIDTSAFVEGAQAYLGTSGNITTTKPSAPNHIVYACKIIKVHATSGSVFVQIQNGYELDELHDVTTTDYPSPIDADSLLILDSVNSLWKRLTLTNIKSVLVTYFNTLFVQKNTAITGATKTKITYDAKGLVTSGADATTDDIGEGITNLYWSNSRTINSILTGLSVTGSTILSTDTILAAFGKAQNQINSLIGGVNYQGSWNASTNNPSLLSGIGTKGYYYVVSVAGTTNLDGITDWKLGDWAIYNGTIWQKIDNTDAVISVNGYTGIVTLTTADISDSTNKRYVTDAQLVVIGNTSGTNTGDETAARIGAIVNGATAYATPLNADKIGIWDTANSLFKAVTWANIKTTLKAYFDTIYTTTSAVATQISTALSGYLTALSAAATYQTITNVQNNTSRTASITGTDTYSGTLSPAITAYVKGQEFNLTDVVANTITTPTINLGGGVKNILDYKGAALTVGVFAGNVTISYDGTAFRMHGDGGGGGGSYIEPIRNKISYINSNYLITR